MQMFDYFKFKNSSNQSELALILRSSVLLTAAAMALLTFSGIYLASVLGAETMGRLATYTIWFNWTVLFGEFGLCAAATYYVSKCRSAETVKKLRIIGAKGILTTGVLSVLSVGLLALVFPSINLEIPYFFVICAVPIALVWVSLPRALLQSLNNSQRNRVRLAQAAVYSSSIVIAGSLDRLTVGFVLIMILVSLTFEGLLIRYYMRISLRNFAAISDPEPAVKRGAMFEYATASFLATLPFTLTIRLDQTLMTFLTTKSELGVYVLAASISSAPVAVVAAIGTALFPHLARHGLRPKERETWVRFLIVASVGTLIWGLVVAYVLQRNSQILGAGGYLQVPQLLLILSPGAGSLSAVFVLSDVIRGLGKPRQAAIVHVIGALVTTALLVALLPSWGAVGAAWASTISYSLLCLTLVLLVRRKTALG